MLIRGSRFLTLKPGTTNSHELTQKRKTSLCARWRIFLVNRPTNIFGAKNVPRLVGWLIVGAFILAAVFADFLSPYDYREQSRAEPSAPASSISFTPRPQVRKRTLVDPLRTIYVDDDTQVFPVELFVHGSSYGFFGMQSDLHLFGVAGSDAPRINLLGTDNLGRDRFSRLLHSSFSLV